MSKVVIPKVCPHCGEEAEGNFVADYLEAVYQGVTLSDDGEDFDYDGVYGHYDDGSTDNECIRCRSCGNEVVVFGQHQLILAGVYTIIGVYPESWQRYADTVEAETSIEAAKQAPPGLFITAIVRGEVGVDMAWEGA